jgi:hypothetical protein
MKSRIQIEGFENQVIEVEHPGLFNNARILVNGSSASTVKRNEFILKRSDGRETVVKIKPSVFSDALSLQVDGKTTRIVEPLPWYQYLLSCVPVIFIFLSPVGWLITSGLILANMRIFRSKMSQPLKYVVVLAIGFVSPVLYLILFPSG